MRACVRCLTTQRLGDLTAPLLVIRQIQFSLLVDLFLYDTLNENIKGEEAGRLWWVLIVAGGANDWYRCDQIQDVTNVEIHNFRDGQ